MSLQEQSMASTIAYTTPLMNIDGEHLSLYRQHADWPPMPGSIDGQINRHSTSSNIMPIAANGSWTEAEDSVTKGEVFDQSFSWTNTPRTDMASDTSGTASLAPWFEYETNLNTNFALGLDPDPDVYFSWPRQFKSKT
jgi:hypothetical protein